MTPIVFYHANCYDGAASAFLFKTYCGEEVALYPIAHGDEFPFDRIENRNVFFLDFSMKYEDMARVAKLATHFTIIDHHEGAQQDIDKLLDHDNVDVYFDLKHSGCILTYIFLLTKRWKSTPYPAPEYLNYIEDRDLWKFKLHDSHTINAGIASFEPSVEGIQEVNRLYSIAQLRFLHERGLVVQDLKKKELNDVVQNSFYIVLDNFLVPAVNCSSKFIISELGEYLSRESPFAAVFYLGSDYKYRVSLRSRIGAINVFEVAKKYGGGGHRNAAGFVIDKKVFDNIIADTKNVCVGPVYVGEQKNA